MAAHNDQWLLTLTTKMASVLLAAPPLTSRRPAADVTLLQLRKIAAADVVAKRIPLFPYVLTVGGGKLAMSVRP